MDSIFDHPGFMSYGAWQFEVLHADWPVYPAGHGWEVALRSLAVFPSNVRFQQIDDIDQCFLFVVLGTVSCLQPTGDLCDHRWFHVAAWRDDITELHRRGLVSGLSFLTEFEAALDYYEKHKDLCFTTETGLHPLNLPRPDADDFDPDSPPVLRIAAEGLALTPASADVLQSLSRPVRKLECNIRMRAEPLVAISLFDTAVREAGVILETRLREITASASYGQALVDEYYKLLCNRSEDNPRAVFKVLRSELRSIFKFVRNDFAHALHEITRAQCLVLLDRTSSVLEMINDIERVETEGAGTSTP